MDAYAQYATLLERHVQGLVHYGTHGDVGVQSELAVDIPSVDHRFDPWAQPAGVVPPW